MDRRTFLYILLGGAGAAVFGTVLYKGDRWEALFKDGKPMDRLLHDARAIEVKEVLVRIGGKHFQELRKEQSEEELSRDLRNFKDDLLQSLEREERPVEKLKERIGRSFSKDELVRIEGWFLAEEEARICGLIHAYFEKPELLEENPT